ncbi:hypothetical protein JAAARDRAFT_32574 [Jaapia argillacea MUCL 33604]|uniref:Uncharacterized protein n=1 Tax=Jaapia argillacea MUCL 33604 TaxID=933084 RepID=A0A067Q9K3_9AGAM|nr:hypothetical protein JAAARDRAFT_32574 [Jaapia argillacea MUCL 33604]
MLPFPLKLVWFIFSLSGLFGCWIVLWAFAQSAQVFWSPLLYCLGVTLLEGVFCLGMVWRMDPFLMPRAFCQTQVVVISFGACLMTGVAASYTIGTTLSLLRPSRKADSTHLSLSWHLPYLLLVAVYPLLASAAQVAAIVKLDAVHPSDGLQCDATHPIWVRLLGYAGAPLLLSIPGLVLSAVTAVRLFKAQKLLPRTRSRLFSNRNSDATQPQDNFTRLPVRNSRRKSFPSTLDPSPRPIHTPLAIPSPPPSLVLNHPHLLHHAGRVPTSPVLSSPTRKYHLPFASPDPTLPPPEYESGELRPPSASTRRSSVRIDGEDFYCDASDSSISSGFPTFAPPSKPPSLKRGKGVDTPLSAFPDLEYQLQHHSSARTFAKDDESNIKRIKEANSSALSVVGGEGTGEDAESESRWDRGSSLTITKSDLGEMEYEGEAGPSRCGRLGENAIDDDEDDWTTPKFVRRDPRELMSRQTTNRPPPAPSPSPMIWHLVIFQTTIFFTMVLASISTLIDLIKHNTTSTPFGTHHVAFLLAAWAPCLIFGNLQPVRHRLSSSLVRWRSSTSIL